MRAKGTKTGDPTSESGLSLKTPRYRNALVLMFILALVIFLHLPTMSDLLCDPDVSGICYSGKGLLKGYLPYRDSVESKPPGAYFLAAFAFGLFGESHRSIYLLSMLWHVGIGLTLYWIGRRFRSGAMGLLCALLFTFFSTLPYVNGLCPNYETWVLLPALLAFAFALSRLSGGSAAPAFLSGLFASLSMQIKFQAFFPALALFLVLLLCERSQWKRCLSSGLLFVAGGLIGLIPLVAFYRGHGGVGWLMDAFTFSRPLEYAEENRFVLFASFFPRIVWEFVKSGFLLVVLGLAGVVVLVREGISAHKNNQAPKELLLLAWFVGCLLAVFFLKGLFSKALFASHYYILSLPAWALIASRGLIAIRNRFPSPLWRGGLLAVVLAWLVVQFGGPGINSVKAAGELYRTGNADDAFNRAVLYTFLDRNTLRPLGKYLKSKTSPDDFIYVWDYMPAVYLHADRRAPTRHYKHWEVVTTDPWGHYFNPRHPAVVKGRRELMNSLTQTPPEYVVTFRYYRNRKQRVQTIKNDFFDELEAFVDEHYALEEEFPLDWDPVILYKRRQSLE